MSSPTPSEKSMLHRYANSSNCMTSDQVLKTKLLHSQQNAFSKNRAKRLETFQQKRQLFLNQFNTEAEDQNTKLESPVLAPDTQFETINVIHDVETKHDNDTRDTKETKDTKDANFSIPDSKDSKDQSDDNEQNTHTTNKIDENDMQQDKEYGGGCYERLYQNELENRILQMEHKQEEHQKEVQRQYENYSKLEKELEYYRKKATLEQKTCITQSGLSLILFANLMESITNMLNMDCLNMENLSTNVREGVENGDFDLFLKSISNHPTTMNVIHNPMTSFIIVFGGIVMKTHLSNAGKKSKPKKKPPTPSTPRHVHSHSPQHFPNNVNMSSSTEDFGFYGSDARDNSSSSHDEFKFGESVPIQTESMYNVRTNFVKISPMVQGLATHFMTNNNIASQPNELPTDQIEEIFP